MRRVLTATAVLVVAGLGVGAWLLLAAPGPAPAPPVASAGGPVAGAAPAAGSEVLPPAESPRQQQPADRLPPRPAAAPRIALPLPPTADAQGELVAGFPSEVAAPIAGADVIDSSVASEGEVMQFSLRGRAGAAADEVLAHYRERWAGLGLAPVGASETAPAYRDDFSSVTVSAEQTGTGTIFTVYGVLRAG